MPRENHLTGDVRITQTLAEKKKNHPNLLASTIKYQLPGTRKRISKSQSEPAYNPVSGTRERGDEAEGDKRLGVNSRGQTLSKCPRHRHGDVGAAQRRRKSPVSPVGETGVFLPPKGQHESSHRLDRSTAPPLRTGVIRRRRSTYGGDRGDTLPAPRAGQTEDHLEYRTGYGNGTRKAQVYVYRSTAKEEVNSARDMRAFPKRWRS